MAVCLAGSTGPLWGNVKVSTKTVRWVVMKVVLTVQWKASLSVGCLVGHLVVMKAWWWGILMVAWSADKLAGMLAPLKVLQLVVCSVDLMVVSTVSTLVLLKVRWWGSLWVVTMTV